MIARFYDVTSGGFFDSPESPDKKLGVLGTRRKPFQDSPTPAGNSVAAIVLVRMYGYTNDRSYREKAEQTLELLAGVAGQYGLFAATYGIAAVHLSQPHTQVIVVSRPVEGDELARAALAGFAIGKSVLNIEASKAVAQNLPPALAETIPGLPAFKANRAAAVICSDFACQPPIDDPKELGRRLLTARG
jgi:uncharacterized protein YyaL (SSP411 family)